MNNDVVTEILLHLPVRSLLKFRAVCKFWCDVIDSTRFCELHNELHINNNNDNDKADDAVCIQFTCVENSGELKLSTELIYNGFLISFDLPSFDLEDRRIMEDPNRCLEVAGAVKGLICISDVHISSIVVCNPFLGQLKILPLSPHNPCHLCGRIMRYQQVGIGFDEDYKVVQLLCCIRDHGCVQAYLYSRRTDSWRELALDQELSTYPFMKSSCRNGSFVYWLGWRTGDPSTVILSFDMKNEVFRTFTISSQGLMRGCKLDFLAKDDCSFFLFVSCIDVLKVYESRVEGNELIWTLVTNLVTNMELAVIRDLPLWRGDDFAVLKKLDCAVWRLLLLGDRVSLLLYDCRAREFIARLLPEISAFVEYEGSFISP
ncbi:putative F-box only protein 11 [Salvia hispanica]|uniref:putative F-box only protein 11 n=1 Tax=Salvia hispanica TaxID=49212 RepID=UPI002009CA2D|nr:putative F-box only protein 11 [Salvia hispanica]